MLLGVGDELFKAVGALLPDPALLREPVVDEGQPLAIEHAGAHPAGLDRVDEPVRFERPHVFHERRQGHRELACQLADGRGPMAQVPDDGAPGRVGKGDEHAVQMCRILCHKAKYAEH